MIISGIHMGDSRHTGQLYPVSTMNYSGDSVEIRALVPLNKQAVYFASTCIFLTLVLLQLCVGFQNIQKIEVYTTSKFQNRGGVGFFQYIYYDFYALYDGMNPIVFGFINLLTLTSQFLFAIVWGLTLDCMVFNEILLLAALGSSMGLIARNCSPHIDTLSGVLSLTAMNVIVLVVLGYVVFASLSASVASILASIPVFVLQYIVFCVLVPWWHWTRWRDSYKLQLYLRLHCLKAENEKDIQALKFHDDYSDWCCIQSIDDELLHGEQLACCSKSKRPPPPIHKQINATLARLKDNNNNHSGHPASIGTLVNKQTNLLDYLNQIYDSEDGPVNSQEVLVSRILQVIRVEKALSCFNIDCLNSAISVLCLAWLYSLV